MTSTHTELTCIRCGKAVNGHLLFCRECEAGNEKAMAGQREDDGPAHDIIPPLGSLPRTCRNPDCCGPHYTWQCPQVQTELRRPILICDNCDKELPIASFTFQCEPDMCICDPCYNEAMEAAPPFTAEAFWQQELERENVLVAVATSIYTKQQALIALLRLRQSWAV